MKTERFTNSTHPRAAMPLSTDGSAFTSVRSGGVRSQKIEKVHGTVHSLSTGTEIT